MTAAIIALISVPVVAGLDAKACWRSCSRDCHAWHGWLTGGARLKECLDDCAAECGMPFAYERARWPRQGPAAQQTLPHGRQAQLPRVGSAFMATDPNAFTVEDVEEEASDPEGPDAWEVVEPDVLSGWRKRAQAAPVWHQAAAAGFLAVVACAGRAGVFASGRASPPEPFLVEMPTQGSSLVQV